MQEINPTNRTLRFVVPVTDGPTYLGDVNLRLPPTTPRGPPPRCCKCSSNCSSQTSSRG